MSTGGPVNRRTFLVGLLGTAALAACSSGVPGSGPVVVISSAVPPQPTQAAAAPAAGASQAEIVNGFVEALGSNQPDAAGAYSAARQYLTPQTQQVWQPDSTTPILIINQFRSDTLPEPRDTVQVEAEPTGRVDASRAYNWLPSDEPQQLNFTLLRINGEWRISKLPDEILLREEAFGRLYLQRRAYFLDPGGAVAVPDLRYILATGTAIQRANRVLNLLLAGPSADLRGAVRNDMAAVELRRPPSLESGIAQVDLTQTGDLTSAQRRGLAAQLVWSLSQDLASVRITLNDEPLDPTQDLWTTQDLGSFDPNGIPGSVAVASEPFYLNSFKQVVNLTTGIPVEGPLGNGEFDVVGATLSAATGRIAAVIEDDENGQELVVGSPGLSAELRSIEAQQLVSPSFNRNGNQVWVSAKDPASGTVGILQVSVPTEAGDELTWTRVVVPNTLDLSRLEAIALSPDGVRIALAVGGQLLVGTIEFGTGTTDSSTSAPAGGTTLSNLRQIRPDLSDVTAVVFAGATELLVAARTTRFWRSLFRVDLDGSALTTTVSGELDLDATAVAVNGPVGAAGTEIYGEFNGRILQRLGGFEAGRWENAPARNGAGSLPGSDPFFPS